MFTLDYTNASLKYSRSNNFIHVPNSFAITIDSDLTTIDEMQFPKNERNGNGLNFSPFF